MSNCALPRSVDLVVPDDLPIPGQLIAQYRVIREVGQGGMGVVFEAEDTRLARRVALKFLNATAGGREASLERFIGEARLASSLDHANVCTIHEISQTASGRPFIVMPMYRGQSLDKLLESGPVPTHRAFEVLRQVGAGLTAAHARGIVHRDIKPANLFVLDDGGVKILDFGLATLRSQVETLRGGVVGTPTYMAPEQVRGEFVDERADVWSLAVVAYRMLTGTAPFVGSSSAVLFGKIRCAPPIPLRRVRRDLPEQLERTLEMALEKSPSHRYQTVEDFVAALTTCELRPVALSDGSRVGMWRAALAVLPFEDLSEAHDREHVCDGLTEQLISILARVPDLKVIARTSAMAYKGRIVDVRLVGEQLGVSHVLQGSLRLEGERARVTANLVEAATGFQVWSRSQELRANDVIALQDETAGAIADALELEFPARLASGSSSRQPRTVRAFEEAMRAISLTRRFYYSLDPSDLSEAIEAGRAAIADDPAYAYAYVGLSYVYAIRYYVGRQPEDLERADHYAATVHRLAPGSSEGLMCRGGVLDLMGKSYGAFQHYCDSLAADPNNALALHLLGRCLQQVGLFPAAIRSYDRTIELDPLHPEPFHNRGHAFLRCGNYAAARRDFVGALQLEPRDHAALAGLAELAILQGDLVGARQLVDELAAMPLRSKRPAALLAAARGDLVASEMDDGPEVAALLGDFPKAVEMLEQRFAAGHNDWLRVLSSPVFDGIRPDLKASGYEARSWERYHAATVLYRLPPELLEGQTALGRVLPPLTARADSGLQESSNGGLVVSDADALGACCGEGETRREGGEALEGACEALEAKGLEAKGLEAKGEEATLSAGVDDKITRVSLWRRDGRTAATRIDRGASLRGGLALARVRASP